MDVDYLKGMVAEGGLKRSGDRYIEGLFIVLSNSSSRETRSHEGWEG